MNALTRLQHSSSPALRLLVGALLVTLVVAGALAVSARKTVTLDVDGTAMAVTTMKSRVADIVEESGFDVTELIRGNSAGGSNRLFDPGGSSISANESATTLEV